MLNNYRQRRSLQEKRSTRLNWLLVIVCVIATLVYLRSRLWVIDLSYEYNVLQKKLRILKEENGELRVEVGKLKSPARIEKIAHQQLGLRTRDEMKSNVAVVLRQPLER